MYSRKHWSDGTDHVQCVLPQPKGPVSYADPTQQSSRVVLSCYMGPGVVTTVGGVCTTDPSGCKT